MYGSFLIAGLLLALDGFLVSVPIGAMPLSTSSRRRLALSFAVCDGLASFLGWIIGTAEWTSNLKYYGWLGPLAVGCYGLYVLSLAWHSGRMAATKVGGWLVLGLPLCLSLDNLAVGLVSRGSAGSAVLMAIAFGAVSGGAACVGLWFGATLATRASLRSEWLTGTALVAVAIALFCKDIMP
jgi:putative Mn2+ efflux pump MntP